MNHLSIKNLSIALEALSRINSYEAYDASKSIYKLLEEEINAARRSPTMRPDLATTNPDDDIPF